VHPVVPQGNGSGVDADGIRVVALAPRARWVRPWPLAAAALAVVAGVWMLQFDSEPPVVPPAARTMATTVSLPAPVAMAATPQAQTTANRAAPAARAATASPAMPSPSDWPSGDPNDLASHFSPGDPEPTMGELIQALRDSGITTGIAAFNPPGTSPPLIGLAVPADFMLPPGYVRHHQVTDDGELLEPILMFSPDYAFTDASGRPLSIPENRVVPPELAPPGLPIREIEVPTPDAP
jgi:hypothetical protein